MAAGRHSLASSVTRRRLFVLLSSVSLAWSSTGVRAASAAIDLLPHEAAYQLKLIRSDSSANVQDVRGLFRYEISGNSCDGYTVNVELSNRIVDRGGNITTIDQFTTSYEDTELGLYTFEERQDVNGRTVETTRGEAEGSDNGVFVQLISSDDAGRQKARIERAAVFPVKFMMDTIEAARAGDVFFQRYYYDGSEGGEVAFEATGVIGKKVDDAASEHESFFGKADPGEAWRVSLAYFKEQVEDQRSEVTPDYQITFTLFENGVSNDLMIDYGDFAISGYLIEFEELPKSGCPGEKAN